MMNEGLRIEEQSHWAGTAMESGGRHWPATRTARATTSRYRVSDRAESLDIAASTPMRRRQWQRDRRHDADGRHHERQYQRSGAACEDESNHPDGAIGTGVPGQRVAGQQQRAEVAGACQPGKDEVALPRQCSVLRRRRAARPRAARRVRQLFGERPMPPRWSTTGESIGNG